MCVERCGEAWTKVLYWVWKSGVGIVFNLSLFCNNHSSKLDVLSRVDRLF